MVIGAGFVAKRTVRWTARKVGFSDRAAVRLGNLAKWGVALATLDVSSLLLDGVTEAAVDNVSEAFAGDAVADSAADAALVADVGAQTSREAVLEGVGGGAEDLACVEEEEEEEEEAAVLYAAACPELGPGDTEGYASEGADEDGEDAAEALEEIEMYVNMAAAAYESCPMTRLSGFDMVEQSQVISDVIDPTHLFGIFGETDTEVHVSILDDESVVFAFRGTEPKDWRSQFGDVLTDLAESQQTVRFYDASTSTASPEKPVYTSSSLIRAHRGFQLGLKDVTDTTNPEHNLRLVLEGLGMQAEDVHDVVCVGHSLGGALATLCAKWCREVAFPTATIGCVTIGSPRVGNTAFAVDFELNVVDGVNYRVVNKRDMVPCMPNLLTYPSIGSAYKHVSKPIYMIEDETGTLKSQLGGQRPSLLNLGFLDHSCDQYLESMGLLIKAG